MPTSLNRVAVAGLCLTMLTTPVMANAAPVAPPTNSCTFTELLVVMIIIGAYGRTVATVETDPMGNFRTPVLPPGDYELRIDAASLNKSLATGGAGPEGAPEGIGILIALLMPAFQQQLESTQVTFKRGSTQGPSVRFMIPAGSTKGQGGAISGSIRLLK